MPGSEIWTPPRLVGWIAQALQDKKIPPPHRLEAELLVADALGLSRIELYLQYDRPSNEQELEKLRHNLKRRLRREPLGYILGECEFWGLKLAVGPGVLVPRSDTELLVEKALDLIDNHPQTRPFWIMDLGTGSLALPLALCSERTGLRIVAVEPESKALEYAKKNLDHFRTTLDEKNNKIFLVQNRGFEGISPKSRYSLILSNPPYIAPEIIERLEPEVKSFEPRSALDGGPDGLLFYRMILNSAAEILEPEGNVLIEHGYDQREALLSMVGNTQKLKTIECFDDLGQNARAMSLGLASTEP